ncbi:hypothetical protein [Oceanivirga salmonicida]|uniref:hypothetical protein n=1 Tax=Oceanivirga salmonicida TaxID=1769291 RepID=UPI0012E301BD|nr:hypothetical protein [Oceanivirga salmonicida]
MMEIPNGEYKVITINYEKEKGINIYDSIEEYKKNMDKDFYKLYIFNENEMHVYIDGDKYSVITKNDIKEKLYTRQYYYEFNNKNGKLNVTFYKNKEDEYDFYYSGIGE